MYARHSLQLYVQFFLLLEPDRPGAGELDGERLVE